MAILLVLSLACGVDAFAQSEDSQAVKRIKVARPDQALPASQERKGSADQLPAQESPSRADGKLNSGQDDNDCLRRWLRGLSVDEDCCERLKSRGLPVGEDCKVQRSLLMGQTSDANQPGQAATEAQSQPDKAQALAEAQIYTTTNYATRYDNYEGEFVWEAKGDKGGFAKLALQFDGFFVRPVLTLTHSQQGTIPYSPDYKDHYEIIPQNVSASVSMHNARHCAYPNVSDIFGSFTAKLTEKYSNQEPPNYESRDLSIPKWINAARSGFLGQKLRFSLNVESQQATGGEAWLSIDAYALAPGVLKRRNGERTQEGKLFFTQANHREQDYLSVGTGSFDWQLPGRIKVKETFSLQDISLSYSGSARVQVDHCPLGSQQLSDRQWQFSYRLNVRAKKDFEAILAAVDKDSATYQPKPNDTRTFRLTIKKPQPQEVQAVRFTLEDVSSHPGVATNAGNHLLGSECRDCTLGKQPDITYVNTNFTHADGGGYSIRRACVHYNACPIDNLPDLFFSERENGGFDLSQGGTKENLQYTISPVAKPKRVSGDTVDVKVTVKDGAASGKLKAEIQVAGVWYPARAQGPSDGSRTYLSIPMDKNGNGMSDSWERLWKVSDPDADDDYLPNNPNRGDGLTIFEEYRGIFWRGNHNRLSPTRKDVFVHDYSKVFSAPLGNLFHLFSSQAINLWPIRSDEHKEEVVNFHQGSQHKKGDQYIIVVMALSQCPGLDMGRAQGLAYVSPPISGYNTVMVMESLTGPFAQLFSNDPRANEGLTATLGHEIGHNMNIPHHGEGDGFREVEGREAYIACRHGLFSGQLDCFMKYPCADYFLDMDFVPQSSIVQFLTRGLLQPFPSSECGQRDCFCQSSKGTGVCRDARQGNCLGQIKLKSYQ